MAIIGNVPYFQTNPSAQVNLEVAEYALSPTYPLMCWIYRQIKRKEGVISGSISETPKHNDAIEANFNSKMP